MLQTPTETINARYAVGDSNTTTVASIEAKGDVQATYSGQTMGGNTVVMEIDFGDSSFDATFNGGSDTGVTETDGVLDGGVGFFASGQLSGAGFRSTSVSASDGTVTGTVEGRFYGLNPDTVAGVADIQKTTGAYSDASYADVFTADK